MNIAIYKFDHPECELAHLFPREGREIVIPLRPAVRFPIFGGRCYIDATDLHHIIGGDPVGRTDDERNVLHLNLYVHKWLTEVPKATHAGRVLCCFELQRQGRLDWAFLSSISRKCFPSILDTEPYIEACREFTWVETFRRELIRKAA